MKLSAPPDPRTAEIAHLTRRVAELEHAEKVLRANREHLTAAQRVSQVGSWEWDLIEDRFWWSEEFYRVLGLDPYGVAPSFDAFIDAIHPDDRRAIGIQLRETFDRSDPTAAEFRTIHPDGTGHRILSRAILERTPRGTPSRIFWTAQDITKSG